MSFKSISYIVLAATALAPTAVLSADLIDYGQETGNYGETYSQPLGYATGQVCDDLKLVYPRSGYTEFVNVCHKPVFGKFID